jgi:hypothetical protein
MFQRWQKSKPTQLVRRLPRLPCRYFTCVLPLRTDALQVVANKQSTELFFSRQKELILAASNTESAPTVSSASHCGHTSLGSAHADLKFFENRDYKFLGLVFVSLRHDPHHP